MDKRTTDTKPSGRMPGLITAEYRYICISIQLTSYMKYLLVSGIELIQK